MVFSWRFGRIVATSPSTLASAAAVRRYVAAERNAIGYIRGDQVDDSVRVVLAFGD